MSIRSVVRGKTKRVLLLASCLVPLAYSQQPAPSGSANSSPAVKVNNSSPSPGKVVIKVGDTQVTAEDFEFLASRLGSPARQAMQAQGRRAVAEQYALMLVLSQEAINRHLDSTPGFRIQRIQMLAQAAYENLARQVDIKPEEVSQYFATHQAEFEEARVRQVTVRKKPEGANQDAPGLPADEARNRAEAIRKAITAGNDPKKLAQDFKDPKNVQIDTDPRPLRHGYLPPSFDKVVFELKDGEVSQPLENPQGVLLFQMVGHRLPELKEVRPQIENTLRQQKAESGIAELKKKIPVWMDEGYFAPPKTLPSPPTVQPPPSKPQPQK